MIYLDSYHMRPEPFPVAFSNILILDARWMLNGVTRDPSAKSIHLWASILTMNANKQKLFIARVFLLHDIAVKQGGRASVPRLSLSDWNTEANRCCFLAHCIDKMIEKTDEHGNPMFTEELIDTIMTRAVEGCLSANLVAVNLYVEQLVSLLFFWKVVKFGPW